MNWGGPPCILSKITLQNRYHRAKRHRGDRRRPAGDANDPDRLCGPDRSGRPADVARLDRPSGNITGFADFEASLGGKWLELLSEIAPGLKRVAVVVNATDRDLEPA
jgi:hypothetical protein